MLYNVLVLNYEYPPLGGGAGVITQHLTEEFVSKGHHVTVLTAWYEGLEREEISGNKRIIRLPSRRSRLDRSNVREMYSYISQARQYVREHIHKDDFDICLANFTLPGGLIAMQLKEEIGLPFVVISHGHDIPWFYPRQMFLYHLGLYPLIWKICNRASRLVLLTPEMKRIADRFTGKVRSRKNVIIPNGLHEQRFEVDEKPHDKLKLLFVGRMVDQKDPFLFIRAMEALDRHDIPYEASMLGGGPLMKKIEYYLKQNRLEHVRFEGKVPHRIVIDRMKEAHVMLAPSTHEAMSVSILEALSCGLYVITTPISGNMDIVEENGTLVYSRHPEAFAAEVVKFYRTKFEQGYSRPPLPEAILKQYSWSVVADRYLDLFGDVFDELYP